MQDWNIFSEGKLWVIIYFYKFLLNYKDINNI